MLKDEENVPPMSTLNRQDEQGDTPLMLAVKKRGPKSKEIVQLLLDNKADQDIPNLSQSYPMHVAAKNGDIEILQLLIDVRVTSYN